MNIGVPFVPVRKEGKLPYDTISVSYELEYGKSVLEIHKDAIRKGDKVLIHDDLLATGGTALATAKLIEELGGIVIGFSFIINLSFLPGGKKMSEISNNLFAIATY
jgi:adenine phosphoribosyltransferase